jgi:hypothetical protein
MRSLKTDWRFHRSTKSEPVSILEVACRPNFNKPNTDFSTDLDFEIIYTRYYPDGNHWIAVKTREQGFWESEELDDELNADWQLAMNGETPYKIQPLQ